MQGQGIRTEGNDWKENHNIYCKYCSGYIKNLYLKYYIFQSGRFLLDPEISTEGLQPVEENDQYSNDIPRPTQNGTQLLESFIGMA